MLSKLKWFRKRSSTDIWRELGSCVEKEVDVESGVRTSISSDLERASQSMKTSKSDAFCVWSLQLIIVSGS